MEIGFPSFEKAQKPGCTISLIGTTAVALSPGIRFRSRGARCLWLRTPAKRSRSVRSETRERSDYDGWQKRLRSYRAAEERKNCRAINISPRWGEAANNVPLHFQF